MIGRENEKQLLQSTLNDQEPQFVAVYGRRRIGKTYLIRESFNYSFTFQHTGINNKRIKVSLRKQKQLDAFLDSLKNYGYSQNEKITSWNDAFNILKKIIENSKDEKKVIFLDELSWMNTKGCDLIPALDSFWNGWATARKEKDIILIVCASATSWIIDNIVNDKGGLHNRLTKQINLKPFTLKECKEYLETKNILFNEHQILQCYMVLGGVPYYWSLLEKGKSLAQNIDELLFNENCKLKDEYDNLYKAIFDKPDQYMKIIEALSTTNKGITRDELCNTTNIPSSGELTKKLRDLENCGFIRKYIPFGYTSNNAIYQLLDNFTIFHFKFANKINRTDNFWESNINSPTINSWSGIAFEKVCLEHIPQIKKALGISSVYTEVNSWQCKKDIEKGIYGSQIDLLIVRKDQIINMCEIKYSEDKYIVTEKYDNEQQRKKNDLKISTQTKYVIYPTLITTYGVNNNEYVSNIQTVITSKELFN